jgi:hypothetical protein
VQIESTQGYKLSTEYSEFRDLLDLLAEEISIWLLIFSGLSNLEGFTRVCQDGLDLASGQDNGDALTGKVIARIRRMWAFVSLDQFFSQLTNHGLCKSTDAMLILSAQRQVAIGNDANAFVAIGPFVEQCERLAASARIHLVEHTELRGRAIGTTADSIAKTVFGCSAGRTALTELVQAEIDKCEQIRFGDRGEATIMFAPDFIPSCSLSWLHQPAVDLLERIDGLRAALAWRERAALYANPVDDGT